MNDSELTSLFEKADNAVINPEKKQQAINAAMAEFHAAQKENTAEQTNVEKTKEEKKSSQFQGIVNFFRPTKQRQTLNRRDEMKTQNLKWVYSTVAAASIVLFGSFLTLRDPRPVEHLAPEEQIPTQLLGEGSQQAPQKVLQESLASRVQETRQEAKKDIAYEDDAMMDLAVDMEEAESPMDSRQTLAAKEVAKPQVAPKQKLVKAKPKRLLAQPAPASLGAQDMYESSLAGPTVVAQPHIPDVQVPPVRDESRERFKQKDINPVKLVSEEPVSTFSIDVDTASYSFVRRKLNQGYLPNPSAVRIEEFLNYFDYEYPAATDTKTPFSSTVLIGDSPWKKGNKLLHIGIKGYEIQEQPKSNLVFLLDVSGSMSSPDKLPLVKQSMELLMSQLHQEDTIAIVVYAGAAGLVLEPTPVKQKQKILQAIRNLHAGGSTAGAQGIELAYQVAEQNFDKNAVNRIILATDGDFNVGVSDPFQLEKLVERKREKGVFLSVLGFGQGNYYGEMMQALAQNGNGVAAYIDTLSEAQKVLVHEATSSIFPIAKDVKVQIEFNPATVAEYRLIGYETRHLNREDFNNDKVDAGDIGSGHTVTAIYEITPIGSSSKLIDEGRYNKTPAAEGKASEYALLKLRYKLPNENTSTLVEKIIPSQNSASLENKSWQQREFQFSAAVAGFAQLLKNDKYMGEWDYDDAIEMALGSRGEDLYGYRNELVQLIRKAKIAR